MIKTNTLVLLPVLFSVISASIIIRLNAFVTAFSTSTAYSAPPRSTSSRDSEHEAALIFLHGLGDTPDGWASLEEALPLFSPSLEAANIKYVFPTAPTVELTVNGGVRMPGWFDVFDSPIGVTAKDDPQGLAMSVQRLEQDVERLKEEDGIDPSQIFVGGFGQGAAVALMAAYNRRNDGNKIPFAGCVCLSGWLPMKEYLKVSNETAKATPLFWAHGEQDNKILFEQHVYGVKKLRKAGVEVTARSYAVGRQSFNFEEIDELSVWFDDLVTARQVSKENEAVLESQAMDDANVLLYALCSLGVQESFPEEFPELVKGAAP